MAASMEVEDFDEALLGLEADSGTEEGVHSSK